MKVYHLFCLTLLFTVMTFNEACQSTTEEDVIGKNTTILDNASDILSPEALWAMGRIGGFASAPNAKDAVYGVTYYSVPQNKSHRVIYSLNIETKESTLLTTSSDNEGDAIFIKEGKQLLFLSNHGGSNQLWVMNADGTGRKQVSKDEDDIEGFLLSPDESKIILIKQVPDTSIIAEKYADLPNASGMVINDMMYKHWDQFVTSIPHPFLASFSGNMISDEKDILEGEPYECPMLPFGGTEELSWSPDGKFIAYTCKKKTGKQYALSTDSDIYLYNIESGETINLCKPQDYSEPACNPMLSLEKQSVNLQLETDCQVGYDMDPQFSPDGKYLAWKSMQREGYESDRDRRCVYDIETGEKTYVTESFESGVNNFCWSNDAKTLYFAGVWHGTNMIYLTNLQGEVQQLTDGIYDFSVVDMLHDGSGLVVKRMSMSESSDFYVLPLNTSGELVRLTNENQYFFDHLTMGKVESRWVKTVDGKEELVWVIYPPHFDPSKKYPAILFCEGGPQSPVTQNWHYRWNFQIMAANGYVVVAPNRRGLPGFGMEWLEEISGDYTGLCMKDYLSAIDDVAKEPYVDESRLGCVGASFGGYSVYYLAGHHDGRFKCFIAHDGIYNVEQQYVETEEQWFPNWDLKAAPWTAEGKSQKVYTDSPHLSVDKWDTPILCIHGMKDYRILHSQAESAFNAARLRGIEAQLLLLPDENHWVLKPQNGVLWQRTFFNWLDKWLKE